MTGPVASPHVREVRREGEGRRTPSIDDTRKARLALVAVIDRLIAEFDGAPAGRIIAVVALCRHQLVETGLQGEGLVVATEAMARTRMSPAA